jgi:membrane-bound lytic murein transglycosylase A
VSLARRLALAALAVVPALSATADVPAPTIAGARLTPLAFEQLPGWTSDDHAAAFAAFRRSCDAIARGDPALRPAEPGSADLRAICLAAAALSPTPSADEARRFFEQRFAAFEVIPDTGRGFLTGYFEPEYEGALEPSAEFRAPLLARPDDLVTIAQGEALPGIAAGLQAGRRTEAGGYEPYPDRAAIETGALGERARPIAWVREPGQAFIIQVQGSARLRLPDGRTLRVAYAGRNGHPYTSIGRILVEEGRILKDEMTLARLMGWLSANPDDARDLMRRNRSFVFFRAADELGAADGPIGGAGHPLVAGRSLAVDRTLWSYGLPVWLEGELPLSLTASEPLRRLMIAQDTGSAIVGPARGDFYFGSGAEAGVRAGLLRHGVRFVVLWPRPQSAP